MAFGATITLDFATFHALIRCVCESILRHGFRRLALLNGHGGNIKALDVIAGELKRELGARIVSATYWTVSDVASAFREILDEQPGVAHACEAETSMMLALEPDLVDRDEMARVEGCTRNLSVSGGIYRWRGFEEMTESGVIGFPAAATAEKGERLLAAAAEGVAEALMQEEMWLS
jgi:creatinine amidohydrolase